MKVEVVILSLAIGAPRILCGAVASAPAPAVSVQSARPAPTQPTPARPPTPPFGAGSLNPYAPAEPGPNGPVTSGTNVVLPVPRAGGETNAVVPNGFPGETNGIMPQLTGSNVFLPFTNGLGAFTNHFFRTNAFGYPWSNQFNTNMVIQDQGLTSQDRQLVALLRQELMPEIREHNLPIHLVSQNGIVTVTGFVPSNEESREIMRIIQQTAGVTSAINQLNNDRRVGSNGQSRAGDQAFSAPDRQLLERVRGRMGFHRRGDRDGREFPDRDDSNTGDRTLAESVRIIARDGVVTLFGFVPTAADEQSLISAAQSTPGVLRVDDQLQVRLNSSPGTAVGGASSP